MAPFHRLPLQAQPLTQSGLSTHSMVPPLLNPPACSGFSGGLAHQVDAITRHLATQHQEHQAALTHTHALFDHLLTQLIALSDHFKLAFSRHEMPVESIWTTVDPDRSVGILNVLWHTVSFVCRGNHRPMAVQVGTDQTPVFSGRIICLFGNYLQNPYGTHSQEFPQLLDSELASLYVPASPLQPILMRYTHRPEAERDHWFHAATASEDFLLHILEALCTGGQLHETRLTA